MAGGGIAAPSGHAISSRAAPRRAIIRWSRFSRPARAERPGQAIQVGSFTENYGYDALNRLTSSYGPGLPSKVCQYNAIGNLPFKTVAVT
jgi:hypothetical protein